MIAIEKDALQAYCDRAGGLVAGKETEEVRGWVNNRLTYLAENTPRKVRIRIGKKKGGSYIKIDNDKRKISPLTRERLADDFKAAGYTDSGNEEFYDFTVESEF